MAAQIPISASAFWRRSSPLLPVFLAYRRLLGSKKIRTREMIKRCKYRARPWISPGLKRTELTEGEFEIKDPQGTRIVRFCCVDGTVQLVDSGPHARAVNPAPLQAGF